MIDVSSSKQLSRYHDLYLRKIKENPPLLRLRHNEVLVCGQFTGLKREVIKLRVQSYLIINMMLTLNEIK